MYKKILLGSGSIAALTVAASFFGSAPAMAACIVSSGTLPGVSSNASIDCTGIDNARATAVANNAAANNVTVTLKTGADIQVVNNVSTPDPVFTLGNNASLTLNTGSHMESIESGIKKTAFQSGSGLQALIMSGAQVDGTIIAGANSHVTIAGTLNGFSNALTLSGDNNTVTLNPTYAISATVTGGTSGATNTTLELGGTGSGTFATTAIGAPGGFANFAKFTKTGTSTWTLTGTPTQAVTPWTIGAGTLAIDADAELGDATSTLTLNGGVLQVTATTAGARPIVLGGGSFSLNTGAIYTYSGTFSGTGPLNVSGAGILALTGAKTVAGITGSGNISTTAALTSNQSASTTFTGIISGAGSLVKSGSGTLTLNGVNTYTGGTTVSAGTLGGTGTIGALTVTNGTIAPGSGSTGTFHTGNLVLNTGATTVIGLAPATNTSLAATGTAGVNGALIANAAAGTYAFGTKYTVVTATGTLSGTYSSVSATGLSGAFKPVLSYDAHDVFLTLAYNALTPMLPTGASRNELALAGAIDKAVVGGATLSPAFSAVFSTGALLPAALDQLSGEISGDAGQASSQTFAPFLEFLSGSGDFITNADTDMMASNRPAGVQAAQAEDGTMRLWGSAYGGASSFDAQLTSGAGALNSHATGVMGGVEQNFGNLLAGAGAAIGINHFRVGFGAASGDSTDLMLGLYLRAPVLEHGYVSATLGYGRHNISTQRVVTIGANSDLYGKFSGEDFGGRGEAGYIIALQDWAWTPYAAIAGNTFSAPAYSETALSGPNTFALTYAAQNSGYLHGELGGRLGHDWLMNGDKLSLELHAAWAHQFTNDNHTTGAFQNLAGSSFTVTGSLLPKDSADIGAGLQVGGDSGMTGGARIMGQFGSGFMAGTAMVNLGYRW